MGGGSGEWYHALIYLFSNILPSVGVPLFFFFSGFLLFYNSEWNAATYKRKLRTRARTLLLPYLLWNTIAIAFASLRLLPCLAKFSPYESLSGLNLSLSAVACTFWDRNRGLFANPADVPANFSNNIYPIDVPLWFVRDLMIIIVFAPVIYWLVKKAGCLVPVALGAAWFFSVHCNFGYPHPLIAATFFFSWGAFYSIRKSDFTALFRKLPFLPLLYIAVTAVDIITREQNYNAYIHNAGTLLGIVSAIIITAALLEKGTIRVNSFLAGAAFFVFALHGIIIKTVGMMVFAPFRCDSPYFLIAFYFLVPALTILICLGLYKLLTRYCPALASLLTGGR